MKSRELSRIRVVIVAVLLLATAALLQARGRMEIQPKVSDVQTIPMTIGAWRGISQPIGTDVLETLGDGQYLSRLYSSSSVPPVDLFIAYYSTQRSGDTIHSPKNCLPGSGWTPLESERLSIPIADGVSFNVNRYVVAKGSERQLVMYWYQAHGRVTPSEYMAKIFLVTDSIRMNRSDGGMVRLVTPILPSETMEQTQSRAIEFARNLYPSLNEYIPR
jgi:EpsI family protein